MVVAAIPARADLHALFPAPALVYTLALALVPALGPTPDQILCGRVTTER